MADGSTTRRSPAGQPGSSRRADHGGRAGAGWTGRYRPPRPARLAYHDRPDLVTHSYRYDYPYRDYHGLLHRRIVWPRYRFALWYGYGPWFTWRYFYPYYHRKYVFISLGGYWPFGYNHLRYYWYGCHPYTWYGYYPIAREVQGTTYNYYTYNYYNDESAPAADPTLYENIGQPDQGPEQLTLVDAYFEEAVKAFEAGDYQAAATKFGKAMELAPDDQILPFAYSQALMATEQYTDAARVLREALAKVRPEAEGVFYPRGLYVDEDTLLMQIDRLAEAAETYGFDADLQLLLGYQLLGTGDVDRAIEPLMHAREDLVNAGAAGILLDLAEKIKTSNVEPQNPPSDPPPVSSIVYPPSSVAPRETTAVDTLMAGGGSPEAVESGPAMAQSAATSRKHPVKLEGALFAASLCAIATSAGLRGYTRG